MSRNPLSGFSASPVAFAVSLCLLMMAEPGRAASVANREEVLEDLHGYFPCSDCHADQETDPTPRLMVEEHQVPLEWEDDEGMTHIVEFGKKMPLSDLLDPERFSGRTRLNMAKTAALLNLPAFMEANEFAAEDSVWVLMHGGANIWCLDCHDTEDRDKLRKFNGELLSFNESHLLCGQCHGPILEDWEHSVHGRVNGYWNSEMDEDDESTRLLCVECHIPHDPRFRGMSPQPGPISRIDNISQPAAAVHHAGDKGGGDDLGPHPWEDSEQGDAKRTAEGKGAQH